MVFLFTSAALYLPRDKDEKLRAAIEQIMTCGCSMGGPKTFAFNNPQDADAFAKQLHKLAGIEFIIDPLTSYPNSNEYSLGEGKWVVSFVGYKNKSKTGGTLSDFFQSAPEGKDYTRKSSINLTYAGDELLNPGEDKTFALDPSKKDTDASKKTLEVMQETIANLFLAYRNQPRNYGSMAGVEYAVRTTLNELAKKMGFTGKSPIVDFLASAQGETFINELEKAALEGKFYIGGSASSEWMSNQWSFKTVDKHGKIKWRGIKWEFQDNALDRCQMALDYLNGWLHDAGRGELFVPFLPTVHLIVEPTESVRSNLIELGVEKFSEHCTNKEAIANVRKYLESYYSSERIAQNCNGFGNHIYKLAQEGDADAIKTWSDLTSGGNPALTYTVKGDGTVECQIQGDPKNLFSMASRGKGSVLEAALEQDDARSVSFSLKENITLGISIIEKEKQKFEAGKDGTIKLSVSQTFVDRGGTQRTGAFSGTVVAKIYDDAGNEIACETSQNEDGTYSALFKPQAGKTYSFIAYAYNSDDAGNMTIDSGRVKETIKVAQKLAYNYPLIVVGDESARPGDTVPLKVDISKVNVKFDEKMNETVTQTPTDAILAFGLTVKGSSTPKYFFTPDENAKVKSVYAYSLGSQNIAVDRDLYYKGEKKYAKEQLIAMLKEGVVAINFGEGDGKRWFTLDGRFEIAERDGKFKLSGTNVELPGISADGNNLKSGSKVYFRGEALITSRKPNEVPATEDMEVLSRLLTPGALVLPQKNKEEMKIGDQTYSRDELLKFAEQGVIAFVENESYKFEGKTYEIATVYLINGQKVGPLSNMLAGVGWFPGLLSYHKTSGSISTEVPVHVPDIEGFSGERPLKVICYGRTKGKGKLER